MKSFVLTLLILGALFLGYDYFLAPAGEKMVFKKPGSQAGVANPSPSSVANAGPADRASLAAAGKTVEPPPVAMAPEPTPPPPVPVGPAPAAAAPEAVGLPSVEGFTQNWTKFPPSAFPRPVKLNQDVRFALGAGTAVVNAGGEVVAIEWTPKGLIVAPTADSKARAVVSMESTDFKVRMTGIYDAWKARQLASSPRPDAPSVAQSSASTTAPAREMEADGRPVVAVDGTIPILVAAMKAGRVSEVTPHNITRWGTPKLEKVNGQDLWAVEVDFTSATQMGRIDAESVAHIRNGKILAWVFKGTGEPVP